ncbi:hypothetical protein ACHAW5_005864, partial [Stephanodiscus triporus]
HLGSQFSQLAIRLRERHSIELVFADGPLLDAAAVEESSRRGRSAHGDGIDDVDVDIDIVVDDEKSSSSTSSSSSSPVRYSGLDASLLHLSQIWDRDGGFHGVMGIGQGADVAALLPLLDRHGDRRHRRGEHDEHDDEDDDDEDAEDEDEDCCRGPTMFRGLRFVILVDGRDILRMGDDDDASAAAAVIIIDDDADADAGANANAGGNAVKEDDDGVYVGPDGVRSLHVILERTNDDDDGRRGGSGGAMRGGERLAKMYGPNAAIHRWCRDRRTRSPSSSSAELSNVVGRYLVARKNDERSNSGMRELSKLRRRLSDVERVATLALSEEIRRNPPRAMLAAIVPAAAVVAAAGGGGEEGEDHLGSSSSSSPTTVIADGGGWGRKCDNDDDDDDDDCGCCCPKAGGGGGSRTKTVVVDKVVGAWRGGRRREIGDEGGGAPCPGEFLLREEERR